MGGLQDVHRHLGMREGLCHLLEVANVVHMPAHALQYQTAHRHGRNGFGSSTARKGLYPWVSRMKRRVPPLVASFSAGMSS